MTTHRFDRTEQHTTNGGELTPFRRAVCICSFKTLGYRTDELATMSLGYHLRQHEPVKHRVSRTGRLNAFRPDMQNIPVRTDIETISQRCYGTGLAMAEAINEAEQQGKRVRIEAPASYQCRACGKTGSHEHQPAGRKLLFLGEGETQRVRIVPSSIAETNEAFKMFEVLRHDRYPIWDNDEPGCNDCDGFVYQRLHCQSCGLEGTQTPPKHEYAHRDVMDMNHPDCAGCQYMADLSSIIIDEVIAEERLERDKAALDILIDEIIAERKEAR